MFKPVDVRNGEYTIVYSLDPSLALPAFDPCAACKPDEVKVLCDDCIRDRDAINKERARLLSVARETGDWNALLSPGAEPPTLFTLKRLPGSAFDWWGGECAHHTTLKRPLSEVEASVLLVRLALKKVDNFGTIKIEHERDKTTGYLLVKQSFVDELYEHAGRGCLGELANIAFERATTTLLPKSR